MKVLATFVALLGACALVSGSSVPVLLWGNANDATSVSAIKEYQQADFSNYLKERKAAKTVVFVEDVLSAADISQNRASFKNLQRIKSKQYLPSVVFPVAAIEQLAGESAQHITAEKVIADGALPTGSYVIVALTSSADESRTDVLTSHDAQIATIVALLADSANTLFVYTARQSVPVIVKSRETRQATPTPTNGGAHFNSERLMVYFTNLTFDNAIVPIASLTATLNNATNIAVRLHGGVPTDDLTFDVYSDGRNWWAVENLQFRGERLFPRDTEIGALPEFSYHCGPAIEFRTYQGAHSGLRWSGLQMEPNFAAAGVAPRANFSEPWDCVGFVSPGMLGGFFVTLLMLVIVTIGLTWIMDIRTMDRFDDPKGKAIVVATSE